jgi:threonine dehydrogenase-like Zn-dependent dehydrogenase
LLGRQVVGEINNSCIAYRREELCAACRRGIPTHCLTRTVTGIINHPGAFAEYLVLPVGNVHVLPQGMPLDQAVLIEPLAAAIRTFELSPISPDDTVVILGCGRLGRLIALVASNLGARVIAVGRSAKNLGLVRPFASALISYQTAEPAREAVPMQSASELRSFVLDATSGLGADVVVEATASNENLELAQKLVRPLGTVAMKSTCGRPASGLDTTYSAVHEIRFQGSRCGPFDKAIDFIQEHGAPSSDWITARYPLADLQEAIEAARREAKVMVEMN